MRVAPLTGPAGASGRRPLIVLVLIVLAGIALHAVLWLISEPAERFSDFYKAYHPAGRLLLEDGPEPTWLTTDASVFGFVNNPIVGYLFVPFALFEEDAATWVYLAFGAAATVAALALLLRFMRADTRTALAVTLLFLVNGPLANSLREGNTTHLVLLLLIVALMLWRARARFLAGAVLGVCALIKLPLLLFGLYFLVRGHWRIVAGGAAAIAGLLALSAAVFGIGTNLGWYGCCVEPFMTGVIPAFNVQSLDGFMIRMATGVEGLQNWHPVTPTLLHRIVRVALVAAMLALVLVLIRRPRQAATTTAADEAAPTPRDLLEFVLVLVLAIVVTPVAWTHYYLWLLLPAALYLGGGLPPFDRLARRLLWTGYALGALPIIMLPLGPGWFGEIAVRSLVSIWFIGGVLVFAALARCAWQAGRAPAAIAAEA